MHVTSITKTLISRGQSIAQAVSALAANQSTLVHSRLLIMTSLLP